MLVWTAPNCVHDADGQCVVPSARPHLVTQRRSVQCSRVQEFVSSLWKTTWMHVHSWTALLHSDCFSPKSRTRNVGNQKSNLWSLIMRQDDRRLSGRTTRLMSWNILGVPASWLPGTILKTVLHSVSSFNRQTTRMKNSHICVISGLGREVGEICALPGHYAAYSDNSLPTFRDNLSLTLEDKTRHRYGISTIRCVISQKSQDLNSGIS